MELEEFQAEINKIEIKLNNYIKSIGNQSTNDTRRASDNLMTREARMTIE